MPISLFPKAFNLNRFHYKSIAIQHQKVEEVWVIVWWLYHSQKITES